MIGSYQERPAVVQAVQFDGNNGAELAQMLGSGDPEMGTNDAGQTVARFPRGDSVLVVAAGQWLVDDRLGASGPLPYDAAMFQQRYTPTV